MKLRTYFSRRWRAFHTGRLLALLVGFAIAVPASLAPATPAQGAGPQILAVAVDPRNSQNVYAGTIGGVYVSTNGGNTWTAKTANFQGITVDTLVVDPSNSNNVYAGGIGGFLKSTDQGSTWTPSNSGLTDTNVYALGIDFGRPATIHAGTGSNVFTSLDSGNTWTPASSGLQGNSVRAYLVDPADSTINYAGTHGQGVYVSTNAAGTWTQTANNGLSNLNINGLTLDPTVTSSIHAATDGGVFNSIDSGQNWAGASGIPNQSVLSIVLDPQRTTTLYAGLSGGGVYQSTDAGGSWHLSSTSYSSNNIYALAETSTGTDIVYAGTDGGVLTSADGGASWALHVLNPLQSQLVINPTSITFLFDLSCQNVPKPVYVSITDASGIGFNWTALSDSGWLIATPPSGPLSPGSSAFALVQVNTTNVCGLARGVYTGHVTVTATSTSLSLPVLNSPQTIPVTLSVGNISHIFLPFVPR